MLSSPSTQRSISVRCVGAGLKSLKNIRHEGRKEGRQVSGRPNEDFAESSGDAQPS